MKKILFATLFMGTVGAVSAQGNINQGDWLLGGDAGFSSQKQGDYKTTTVNFAPNAGYFFIDNFAGGLRLNVISDKEKYGSDESTSSAFSLAPFVRYYFLPSTQKVNLFADASFAFGQHKSDYMGSDVKTNFTTLGIKAGPAIFLTPSTALEIALGYNTTKVKDVDDNTGNFGLEVGFQIHLPGSKK